MSLMYWSIFKGEKYLFKKAPVHWFHVVMLVSGSEHNYSHAFPLIKRERKVIESNVLYWYTILSHHVGQLVELPQVLHRIFMGITIE